ncbi:MAG: biopolymer transporter ExbD [Phycisphaerales bacterium]|nr:MAG: biopolymer transporter ExbD [Phycisphaerales bacterium]
MSAVRNGFRRRNASAVAARHFGPNMTPMVDIVMVILIFFMAGSAFIGPEWFLDVGMAQGVTQTDADAREADPAPTLDLEIPPTSVVLRLRTSDDGATRVTGLGLTDGTLGDLDETLRRHREEGAASAIRIVIEPTPGTAYQDVIRVYDACEQAGVAGVALARSREE